jgi:plastocyanin
VSRRARTALLGALVVIVALTAGAQGWIGAAGARANAADCAWQRHSKRVAKRVKRHGKPRRVVRVVHSWSCDPVVTPVAAAPAPPAPAPAPAPQPTAEPEPGNWLGVVAHEFGYEPSRTLVKEGELTVELNNHGEDAHNLNLQRQDEPGEPVYSIPETASQTRQTLHLDLSAGTYRLWCSLPTHEEKGMFTTIVVGAG